MIKSLTNIWPNLMLALLFPHTRWRLVFWWFWTGLSNGFEGMNEPERRWWWLSEACLWWWLLSFFYVKFRWLWWSWWWWRRCRWRERRWWWLSEAADDCRQIKIVFDCLFCFEANGSFSNLHFQIKFWSPKTCYSVTQQRRAFKM